MQLPFSRRLPTLLAFLAALAVLSACQGADDPASVAGDVEPTMDSLVSAAWLREHLGDDALVVIDATVLIEADGSGNMLSVNGREGFEAGHIPGAVFADLLGDLADADSTLEFAMPSPEQFAAAMGALGVGDDSRVVLYDRNMSVWATRVWWMLRWIGFDRAALLDGGLAAWTAGGRPLSTEPASRTAGQLTISLRPELIVDKDEVLAAIGDGNVNIIDALTEAQYRGEISMYARPGHIAGASNVPMTSLMDETGHYRPQSELDTLFAGNRDTRSINYCGGGIAASVNAFVMTRLGYKDVAVYTASLQEWATDPSLPMEVAADLEESDQ